jgi:hypothetical protein
MEKKSMKKLLLSIIACTFIAETQTAFLLGQGARRATVHSRRLPNSMNFLGRVPAAFAKYTPSKLDRLDAELEPLEKAKRDLVDPFTTVQRWMNAEQTATYLRKHNIPSSIVDRLREAIVKNNWWAYRRAVKDAFLTGLLVKHRLLVINNDKEKQEAARKARNERDKRNEEEMRKKERFAQWFSRTVKLMAIATIALIIDTEGKIKALMNQVKK